MKRICYIMHVNWGWIKQRPHFFAEYLSNDYSVDVYSQEHLRSFFGINNHYSVTKKLQKLNLHIKKYLSVGLNKYPFLRKIKINSIVNYVINHITFYNVRRYDYVWVTFPSLFKGIKGHISSNTFLVYDCMDDAMEFENINKQEIRDIEEQLIKRANLVLCSSEFLKNKLLLRYSIQKNIIVVNNAIELPVNDKSKEIPSQIGEILTKISQIKKPLIYVGTISSWFDFDLIKNVLEQDAEYKLVLFGPTDIVIPDHEQIVYFGPVEREYIFTLMSKAYCLVMPFKVTELIKSVNPVKIYEYIYTGRPVLAPLYGETMKFSEYVLLYDNVDNACRLLKCINDCDYDKKYLEKCEDYVKSNTWAERYSRVKYELEKGL